MSVQIIKPNVFRYLDFRKYLNESFDFEKRLNPALSYISFSKAAGYSSPNLLQMIIQGKRKLTGSNILSTARLLKLKKQETLYFELLVAFNQARTHQDRDYYFRKILSHPKYAVNTLINKKQYRYFEKWYYPVVRELITSRFYEGDPRWIVKRIFPRVTLAEINRSIELLKDLKLIYPDETNGTWKATDNVVQTPGEVSNAAAALYHKNVLELAGNSIDAFGPNTRDLRAVTLRMSEKGYRELKNKMNEYWKEVLALASNEEDSENVYQVNFQLFPLTKKGKARS